MPSATRVSEYALTNFGPLTSVFTPDAACATSTGILQLAAKQSPYDLAFNVDCNVPTVGAKCFPSGSQLDARVSTVFKNPGDNFLGYFSPGVVCPSGWNTVGVAAKGNDGKVSTSGIFDRPKDLGATPTPTGLPLFNPPLNAFTAALDPGETAAVCCPTSMTAHLQGHCFSILADYKPTVGCLRSATEGAFGSATTAFTFFGSATTAAVITVAPSISVSLTTTTITNTAEYAGVSLVPMAIMVRRPEDSATGGGGGPGKDPSRPNAAGSGRTGAADRAARRAFVVGVCAVAMGSAFALAF